MDLSSSPFDSGGSEMKRIFRSLVVAVGVAASLSITTNAQAAGDTSGPSLSLPAVSSFMVGRQVSDPVDADGNGGLYFFNPGTERQFTWTAADPSGICRYTVDEDHGVQGWTDGAQTYSTHATTGQYTYFTDEYENSDDLYTIRVNAYDCLGNVKSVERSVSTIHLEKDYGPTVPSGWARTSCTCAIGDSMLRTSTYKASLRTVVNAAGTNKHVALIMAKGPARGKASIYFDVVYVKTIDTYASANTNRVVMWDKALTGSSNHTIKVVNLATAGRPRIDIDGYVR
jgi:hypothetical protein